MAKYTYMGNPAKLKKFLKKIQSVGIPDKLTQKYLESIGFKTQDDRRIISIMKSLGFAASNGTPTDTWKNYRDKTKAENELAKKVQEHYKELYKMYENAHSQDDDTLINFFKADTGLGEDASGFMVRTFKTLAELSDFKDIKPSPLPKEKPVAKTISADTLSKQIEKPRYVININIQLTLPDTTNKATFDAFFAALKKHLL